MNSATYSAFDIATYFSEKAQEDGISDLTPLKLQKILYFAQGWWLANYPNPLFSEKIRAWKYGPVVREIWELYRNNNVGNITPENAPGFKNTLDGDTKTYLDTVWDKYGDNDAFFLVELTHQTTPWKEAIEDPLDDTIKVESMRAYFTEHLDG